ncbi:MAG TPA: MBL fold metallo-hydrolase [Burkholderiaceae bacterium]|nr:MBL fold metallo-hydrolase [Burkholderiaceae bacterium]
MRSLFMLAGLLAAGLLAACSGTPRAPTNADPVLQSLGHGLWLLPGRFPRERQPDGNSLVLEGRGALLVVDTGRHADHTQALLDFALRRGRPITTVLNTHWHLDHLGGNARLRDALPGLEVVGSPAVARAIAERFPASRRELEGLLANPGTPPDVREMARVDLALYDRAAAMTPNRQIAGPAQALTLAGREVTVGHEAGASEGDLWLLDRASGVLAVGDLVTLPVPFLDTACPAQWREALARVDALPFERLLPGHGPVMERATWRRWRAGFDALLDCAASDTPARTCSARWIENLGSLLAPADHAVVHAMIGHYFAQRLRAADRDRYCGAVTP